LVIDDSSDFEAGDFFGDAIQQFDRDTNPAVHLSITQLQSQDGAIGSGAISILTFVGAQSGACTFEISRENLHLYDSDGNPVEISEREIGAAKPQNN
jgi:hypothetical protein